jgi:hypothetical protein
MHTILHGFNQPRCEAAAQPRSGDELKSAKKLDLADRDFFHSCLREPEPNRSSTTTGKPPSPYLSERRKNVLAERLQKIHSEGST